MTQDKWRQWLLNYYPYARAVYADDGVTITGIVLAPHAINGTRLEGPYK